MKEMTAQEKLEAMAGYLERSGDYKVMRRLRLENVLPVVPGVPQGDGQRLGLYVDCETTGVDPERDQVLELAIVPFAVGDDNEISAVGEALVQLNDPGVEITEEITRITGIDNAMVAGHRLDLDQVGELVRASDFVTAHHSSFDRKFLERLGCGFEEKPWACSMSQIDWKARGASSSSLGNIAQSFGYFFDAHRAKEDCYAALALLSMKPEGGVSPFFEMLSKAGSKDYYVEAVGAPFETKDLLKARGYSWNPDKKVWWCEIPEAGFEEEVSWLQKNVYRRPRFTLRRAEITAQNRFSSKAHQGAVSWVAGPPDPQPKFSF